MAPAARRSSELLILGLAICAIVLPSGFVSCSDPDETLDFCVAVLGESDKQVWQTGTEEGDWMAGSDPSKMGVARTFNETTDSIFPCKDVSTVKVEDFVFKGLGNWSLVTSKLGSKVTKASVIEFPAVNTLQVSAARLDFVKGGLNPPHQHPRATEMLFVLEGSLLVGFVDTANTLFQQTLEKGDLFVFPKGLLHFQMEIGKGEAHGLATFDSQDPGTLQTATALLDSNPAIDGKVIETAFEIDQKTLGSLVAGVSHLT